MVSGIAGILSGILRNSVRLRPECCPESSGMGVRHRPEHALFTHRDDFFLGKLGGEFSKSFGIIVIFFDILRERS